MSKIAPNEFYLLSAALGVLCQHRLCTFLAEMLARLPQCLCDPSDRLGGIIFTHIHTRRDLL